jgi:hypothetical protein
VADYWEDEMIVVGVFEIFCLAISVGYLIGGKVDMAIYFLLLIIAAEQQVRQK